MISMAIRAMLLSLGLFAAYILVASRVGLAGGWLDWLVLIVAASLPLLDRRIRAGSPLAAATIVLANAALMFLLAFVLIALVFEEGL